MQTGLNNKNILITGASRGIGYACAHKFASEGALITMVSQDPERLELARQKISDTTGANLMPYAQTLLTRRHDTACSSSCSMSIFWSIMQALFRAVGCLI